GVLPGHLGLDQGTDVHAVDDDVRELAVDLDVQQLGTADAEPVEVGLPDPDVVEIHQVEPGPGEVDAVEAGVVHLHVLVRRARQVQLLVTHGPRLERHPDDPRPVAAGSALRRTTRGFGVPSVVACPTTVSSSSGSAPGGRTRRTPSTTAMPGLAPRRGP